MYICHRHRIWVKEKTERFGCIYSIWGFWHGCQHMCRWVMMLLMNMCSGFPTGRSKQMICHEMMSQRSPMLFREGTIKGEHTWTSGLSSGYSDNECLGLLSSHRPSTLAVWVPFMEQSITRMNCVLYLSICMYPDLSGELLVSVTSVVWC